MGETNLKAALGYKKFTGQTRILVFDTGYLVVGDLFEGAEDLGWAVLKIPTQAEGVAGGEFVGRLLKSILFHKPDFLVTVNHLGFDEQGTLSALLAEYKIPVASWFVDHPMPILGPVGENTSAFLQVFSFERTSLPWLAEHRYDDPVFLPTGANRRHFHPDNVDISLKETLSCSVSFAGNSWWTKARIEPSAKLRKAAEKAGKGLKVNKGVLLNGFEMELAKKLPGSKRERYAAAQILLAEASMQKRRSFARALITVGIRIHGDRAWSMLAPGVDLQPLIDYQKGLPALFAGSAVNANVTAEQMPTAVNQRVWDVPSTGGFLLTDDQEDALEYFKENEEIAVYRSFEEAADKARYYLKNEGERQAVSARALEKVTTHHTVCHRLQNMAAVMQKRFG